MSCCPNCANAFIAGYNLGYNDGLRLGYKLGYQHGYADGLNLNDPVTDFDPLLNRLVETYKPNLGPKDLYHVGADYRPLNYYTEYRMKQLY
ncbi:MAG: Yae1 family protein [Candidatus Marinimicrobia bacterium]|nr:Yae1 family protein [Candidatus Neomarinimicrobiota bacterium]